MRSASIRLAQSRIHQAGLTNVRVVEGLVQDYQEPFDLAIALHACGEATDLVQDLCLFHGAAFVLCPCCVGEYNKTDGLDCIL